MSQDIRIGIIGGSGLYQLSAFRLREERKLETPFGAPSDVYMIGEIAGHHVAFLPRHARGHRLAPHEIPHRANIHGFKQLGVQWIVSVSAVGSLQEEFAPGHVVLPDQFFDRTKGNQPATFFGEGIVAHIAFGEPISRELQDILFESAQAAGAKVHRGGAYVNMEGPAFSTLAESESYRSAGHAVIGMTNLPEAKLAREAEIAYATIAMVTDYDCWHSAHGSVTVQTVLAWLEHNTKLSQEIIIKALPRIAALTSSPAHEALKTAVITPAHLWPPATYEKLRIFLEKYRPVVLA